MLILRLRQSQVALSHGRLEEAFDLLRDPALATHRAGQRLSSQLAGALVRRGQQHLAAGRVGSAAFDVSHAQALAGSRPDVAALADMVAAAQRDQRQRERRRGELLAAAQAHVNGGRLQLGTALLDDDAMSDVTQVQLLRQQVKDRGATVAAAATAAKSALDQHQLHLAVDEICRARAADDPQIQKTAAAISQQLRQQTQTNLDNANLSAADDALNRHLLRLDPDHPEVRQLQTNLASLKQIWTSIACANYADAATCLARITPLLPSAKWLRPIADQLDTMQRSAAALRSSPLACFDTLASTLPPPAARATPRPNAAAAAAAAPLASAPLPSRFVLHVDGIGSILVLRSNSVTIGPVSAAVAPDIAVVAEPSLPPVHIERIDDDYFVRQGSITAPRRLLAHGQRLALSPRCRFTFLHPCAASTSAVLEFATGCLARGADIRRVVLMDQDLVIGPGAASHLPATAAAEPIVLHARDGQLFCRSRQPLQVNGALADASAPLPVGANLKIGELSLFVDRA